MQTGYAERNTAGAFSAKQRCRRAVPRESASGYISRMSTPTTYLVLPRPEPEHQGRWGLQCQETGTWVDIVYPTWTDAQRASQILLSGEDHDETN